MKKDNSNLHRAKKAKNDEFFTRYEDIEKEMEHYTYQLYGMWVYSPCDDYRWSNFKKYFTNNFERLNDPGQRSCVSFSMQRRYINFFSTGN